MKAAGGIGVLVAIGLIVWWLSQRQGQAQIAELLPGETHPTEFGESEYEKLHPVVPITEHVTKEMPVYNTIEEWEKVHG